MIRAMFSACVVFALATSASAQQRDPGGPPDSGTATLAGVVTDGTSGTPVRRAIVRISGGGHTASTATDADGRFALSSLPAGSYLLLVTKPAWVTSYHGAERPGLGPGTPLALADGEQKLDLAISLVRGAVLAGRVVDANGVPVVGVRLTTMMTTDRNGRRVLATVGVPAGTRSTDQNGEFRLFGLAPGTYHLGVTPAGFSRARLTTVQEIEWAQARAAGMTSRAPQPPMAGPTVGLAPIYYPGTTDVGASVPIVLDAGEERSGLTIRMEYVATTTIRGTMVRFDGHPVGRASIDLIGADGDVSPLRATTIRGTTHADGAFQLPPIPPGRYELWARAGSSSEGETGEPGVWMPGSPGRMAQRQELWAREVLTVAGREVMEIILTLRPGIVLEGLVRADPAAASAVDPGSLGVTLRTPPDLPAGQRSSNASIRRLGADGRFRFDGLPPGEYLIAGQGPGPWTTSSVLVDGVEMFDRIIEIDDQRRPTEIVVTLTDRTATLTGQLTDANGQPAPAYSVLVFATDRSAWRPGSQRIRTTRPDAFGVFTLEAVPPGDYFVAALSDISQVDWATPDVLEQFAELAVRISIAAGQTTTQDIRIAR